jgi:alkanesulfonate monooxygenase SsuD/methylene tetrahydromethanopterin reductase-like flavin-dependent oxidoreductase (luciferase family)
MEICNRLWKSVEPGAILADREKGVYADTEKVKFVDYHGEFFNCETVSPVLPSPQGRPVLFQAGTSGRGLRFGIEHADVVFSIEPNLAGMKRYMGQLRDAAAGLGRKVPGVLFGVQPILGGTEEEAKRNLDALVERMPLDACLARLSGTMGVDFANYDLDKPMQEQATDGSQGLMKAFTSVLGERPFTLREVAVKWGLAVGMPQLVGTPEQVAGHLEHIWRETGCNGYNMTPNVMPSSIENFVDEVVPILQKRGVFRTEYEGKTFAENLELA